MGLKHYKQLPVIIISNNTTENESRGYQDGAATSKFSASSSFRRNSPSSQAASTSPRRCDFRRRKFSRKSRSPSRSICSRAIRPSDLSITGCGRSAMSRRRTRSRRHLVARFSSAKSTFYTAPDRQQPPSESSLLASRLPLSRRKISMTFLPSSSFLFAHEIQIHIHMRIHEQDKQGYRALTVA